MMIAARRLSPGIAPFERFQAALDKAIAAGRERVEAVEATVALKRRIKLSG